MTQSKLIEIVVIGATGSGKSHVLELIDRALRAEYGHHVQIASHDLSCERGLGSPGTKPRVSETIFSLKEQGAPADKATAAEIKEGLRECSASRNSRLGSQLSSGSIDYSHLSEAIDKQHERWEQIHKRVEDTSALLYKWDRTGMPAARVDTGVSILKALELATARLRDELKVGPISNRFIPNAVQLQAMRLVAKLINAGAVALVDDQYVQGEQVFRALKIGEGTASVRDPHAKPEVAEAQSVEAVQGEAVSFMLDPLEQAIDMSVRLAAESEGELTVKLSRHLDALLAEQLKRVTADE